MKHIIAFLLFIICSTASAVTLTPQEAEYVKTHKTFSVCVDPDWYPFEAVNEKDEYYGIAADLLRLASGRAGLKPVLYRTADWDESIKASKEGKCQAVSFLNKTPVREEWLIFTAPHFTDYNVFITRNEHKYISDPSALDNETIVFPEGTAMEEFVRSKYPNLKIIIVKSEKEAFEAVDKGKADMTMRSLIMAAYTIREQGFFNLKIAGQLPDFTNKLSIGVIKSEPVLREVLNKAVLTITPVEREKIINDHVAIVIKKGLDYRIFYKFASFFAVAIVVSFFWILRLNRLNKKLTVLSNTDMLTKLLNRARLTQILEREFERASRYTRPFSIIIFDIDHFKNVNDTYGHQRGDEVLKRFASLASDSIRNIDYLGRWGGEEFLVICPETDSQSAVNVAERIREQLTALRIIDDASITVSGGVAELVADDTVDNMLIRADVALYEAKRTGRNKICMNDKDNKAGCPRK
ncbi:MAG: diguanylate cyclase [Deferribacterales bacterium]